MVQQTIQRICSGRDRHRKTDKTKTLKREGWGLPSRSPERIRVGQSSLCSAGQEDWRPGRWLYLGWGQDWGTGQEGDAVWMASAQESTGAPECRAGLCRAGEVTGGAWGPGSSARKPRPRQLQAPPGLDPFPSPQTAMLGEAQVCPEEPPHLETPGF